jgi:hypothetical protein
MDYESTALPLSYEPWVFLQPSRGYLLLRWAVNCVLEGKHTKEDKGHFSLVLGGGAYAWFSKGIVTRGL